ncbi:hypothetical protein [Streptomyces sp. TLI_105]|uniref:hypothetical protein n=1 Tax=Streptomyces sp. TLI_105 TaxID=1881019 RepID=UPI0008941C92|nr:hypothetical protein [Streptomyces sp. TLI_105]SEE22756.1 hypothetical protein SAMN05428939_7794 [Streptomyces sp. TLI_105]
MRARPGRQEIRRASEREDGGPADATKAAARASGRWSGTRCRTTARSPGQETERAKNSSPATSCAHQLARPCQDQPYRQRVAHPDVETLGAAVVDAGEPLVSYDTLPMVTLRVDNADLQELNTRPGVNSVTEDVPAAPTLNESTVKIGSDQAVAAGKTDADTTVAILDTGVAVNHPFFSGRVKTQACFPVGAESSGVVAANSSLGAVHWTTACTLDPVRRS